MVKKYLELKPKLRVQSPTLDHKINLRKNSFCYKVIYILQIRYARIAQLVERGAYTSVVPGSSPGARTNKRTQNQTNQQNQTPYN